MTTELDYLDQDFLSLFDLTNEKRIDKTIEKNVKRAIIGNFFDYLRKKLEKK